MLLIYHVASRFSFSSLKTVVLRLPIAKTLEKTGALFFAVLLLGRAIPAGQILAYSHSIPHSYSIIALKTY
jgi:hypothetical protein